MIPVWLTPKMLKLTAIGAVILAIFGSGFWVCHKIDSKHIVALETKLAIIEANYEQCLEQNTIAVSSIDELEAAISKQNLAYEELARETQIKLTEQALKSRQALEAYRRATSESQAKLEADKQELLKRMELLTAAESCHEAWEEVVK